MGNLSIDHKKWNFTIIHFGYVLDISEMHSSRGISFSCGTYMYIIFGPMLLVNTEPSYPLNGIGLVSSCYSEIMSVIDTS